MAEAGLPVPNDETMMKLLSGHGSRKDRAN
jgi:hypothetical protein